MYGGCHRNVPLSYPAAGSMIDLQVLCDGLKSTNLLAGGYASLGGSQPRLEHGGGAKSSLPLGALSSSYW